MKTVQLLFVVTVVPLWLIACGSPIGMVDTEEDDWIENGSSPIIDATGKATSYPESALVNMGLSFCSGAVIAPRVAMTAGHCVAGVNRWTVITPYAKDSSGQPQSRSSTKAWTDYVSTGEYVNPKTPDVALIFFDSGAPFDLPVWPKIQMTKVANGTQAINVGRINDGIFSTSNLFVGNPITLGSSASYPYAYSSSLVIQSGDSGGPVFLPGGSPHIIVAVNSGAGGNQILARTDVVANKIVDLVNQHGGFGLDSGGGVDDPGDGGGQPTDCQINEVEPNQPYSSAQAVSKGTICGTLDPATDEDWYKWTVDASGVQYDISLTGTEVSLAMWKKVGFIYYRVANTTATSVKKTSNGAGTYFMVVRSPSGAKSDYRLTLNRSDKN